MKELRLVDSESGQSESKGPNKIAAKVTYALGTRILVLLIITLYRNCKFQSQIYLMNHYFFQDFITYGKSFKEDVLSSRQREKLLINTEEVHMYESKAYFER